MTTDTPLTLPMTADWPPLPPEDCYASAKKLTWFRGRLDRRRQELRRPLHLLDFGCGSAAHAGCYLINGLDAYTGVDIHAPSIAYARANFSGPTARFLLAPPAGERFDVIVLCEVLEHLSDPDGTLATLVAEHLAEDGRVLGSIPNGYGLTEIEKKLDRSLGLYRKLRCLVRLGRRLRGASPPELPAVIPYNHESGHVQFFTQEHLHRVAAAAGLTFDRVISGSVMGADLSGSTILRPGPMIRANVRIADWLPSRLTATWFFEMRPTGG